MKQLSVCILLIAFLAGTAVAAMIKVGDVLDIIVPNHAEFSGRYTVTENGTIDYPLLADDPVVNITTSELMNHLSFRLAKHVDNPLVLISVVQQPEIVVVVLGQVVKPGPVKTYEGATVQEVLLLAGGPGPNANLRKIKIVLHNGNDDNARFFDLREFMESGRMADMPKLQAADTVVLLSEERVNKVKVLGGVTKPGFYDIEGKMNVFEAIYLAGGPAEKADLSRVRCMSLRESKALDETVNIQLYIDKGKMNDLPLVQPGDVIIVYTRWFDWQMLLTIMSNALLFIVTLQALGGVFGK